MLNVYTVRDAKAEAYMQPFFFMTKWQAIRAFWDLVNDGQSQVSRHPGDFALYHLGSYDDFKGVFANLVTPELLATGQELKGQEARDVEAA